jgi:hypothetical protein
MSLLRNGRLPAPPRLPRRAPPLSPRVAGLRNLQPHVVSDSLIAELIKNNRRPDSDKSRTIDLDALKQIEGGTVRAVGTGRSGIRVSNNEKKHHNAPFAVAS